MTRAFEAGATDYVTKPFDVMEIMTRVGLAAKLARSQRVAAEKVDVIRKLRVRTTQRKLKLEEAIPLTDIAGALDFVSFENYLLRLPRGSLFSAVLFTVAIRDVSRLYRRATEYEFVGAVADVGDAISAVLKQRSFFLSYCGNGLYAVLIESGRNFDGESFQEELSEELSEMDLCFNGGAPMTLRIQTGPVRPLGLRSGRGAVDVLMSALANAEILALDGGSRADRDEGPYHEAAG
jgi:hypothetical protein